MKQLFLSILAVLFIFTVTACASPAATTLPTETSTSTLAPAPTATQTLTPTSTPTPEPAKPSVPNGLRPENAATQTLENGLWTVKNADGKITATWNTETKQWDYNAESIKIEQILLGYTGDLEAIKPYLGPLPPDDPATHFRKPDGTPVDYGIGSEVTRGLVGPGGKFSYSATELYVRFRGLVSLPDESIKVNNNKIWKFSAKIFELPQSADTSLILVVPLSSNNIGLAGVPDDGSNVLDPLTFTWLGWGSPIGDEILNKTINDTLIGKMVLILIGHDLAPHTQGTDAYDYFIQTDKVAKAILDYISGVSQQPPIMTSAGDNANIDPIICIPLSQIGDIPIQK
jgi:hypothetical protein